MDNISDFYLTLMSNSSLSFYSENKTSSFTAHLPQKVRLVGEWVVALSEMHYPYNFFNVTEGENKMIVVFNAVGGDEINEDENTIERIRRDVFEIKPGFYKSIGSILKAINNELSCLTKCDTLSSDELSGRTIVHTKGCAQKSIKSITFSTRLAMQTGFRPESNILDFEISPDIGNIYFGIPDQMLIYTDVIEPVLVGHEKIQVIKIVNTSAALRLCSFGDVCTVDFQNTHYMRVMKKEFESVSVDIRDCTGAYMPFRHGVSTVKLHFKRA